jgi:hypothetical protein
MFVSDLQQVGGFYGLLYKQYWPPRYVWNIVESGVRHHNPRTLEICYYIEFKVWI